LIRSEKRDSHAWDGRDAKEQPIKIAHNLSFSSLDADWIVRCEQSGTESRRSVCHTNLASQVSKCHRSSTVATTGHTISALRIRVNKCHPAFAGFGLDCVGGWIPLLIG